MPIEFLPGARRDFDQSFDWYAERSALVAVRFSKAVAAAMQRIAKYSKMLGYIDSVHQSCPVKKFPFRIVFRNLDSQILIVAIAHAKRQPDYWRS